MCLFCVGKLNKYRGVKMITHEFLFVFRKQFAALMLLFIGRSLWAYSSVVTSSANDGSGTLREAIAVAEDGDTITLAVPSGTHLSRF